MNAPTPVLLTLVILGLIIPLSAHGATRPLRDLKIGERTKLQESEQRMAVYDRALQALDSARAKGRISRQEYSYEQRDITAFIGAEARYQNDLLKKTSTFPEDAREVMQNIAKYAVLVPAYIAYFAIIGSSGRSFSP